MKKIFFSAGILSVSLLLSCSKKSDAPTAASFEGVVIRNFVAVKETGNDTTFQYYYYKNGKAVTQTKNPRFGTRPISEYATADKEYFPLGDTLIELDLRDIEQYHSTSARASYNPLIIKSTDESTINGWHCTRSSMGLDGGRKADLWVTADVPEIAYAEYDRIRHLPIERQWRRNLFDSLSKKGLTLIKADMYSNTLNLSSEIVLIEKRSLPDSLFDIPKNIPIKHWKMDDLKAQIGD